MARWRQVVDKETGKSEFVPIDEKARQLDIAAGKRTANIHGVFESFVSPVDGTVIHTARQLREHNLRNNVVCAEEFSQGFLEKKARERADFYEGKSSSKEELARKQAIYEIIERASRNG